MTACFDAMQQANRPGSGLDELSGIVLSVSGAVPPWDALFHICAGSESVVRAAGRKTAVSTGIVQSVWCAASWNACGLLIQESVIMRKCLVDRLKGSQALFSQCVVRWHCCGVACLFIQVGAEMR